MLRPIILFNEAPGDKKSADRKPTDGQNADPGDKKSADRKPTDGQNADPADDQNADPADDQNADPVDDDPDDEGASDNSDDADDLAGDEGAADDPADAVGEQLRREQLYDAIVELLHHCTRLGESAEIIVNRTQDEDARALATRARELVEETRAKCEVVRTRFAELGYQRTRTLYTTLRERVSAVAEIIKHVIDGDDDFRKPDSGNSQRNGSATKQGSGERKA